MFFSDAEDLDDEEYDDDDAHGGGSLYVWKCVELKFYENFLRIAICTFSGDNSMMAVEISSGLIQKLLIVMQKMMIFHRKMT